MCSNVFCRVYIFYFVHQAKYQVKWEGYTESDATWEPIENLINAMDKVKAYMKKNKTRRKR